MPEVICLISSSPPPSHRPPPPPVASKSSKSVTKAVSKTAPATAFELSSSPLPDIITKRHGASTATAPTKDAAASSKLNVTALSTSNSDPKLNERDYVFLDDDFSSDNNVGKEYSSLSKFHERAEKRTAGQFTSQGQAVSPRTAARGSTFISYERHSGPVHEPATPSKAEAAPAKTQITNEVYISIDDNFSSSFDVDKEYELNLPTQKKRKVTPEPERHKGSEEHGLPKLLSSGRKRRMVRMEKDAELDELFGPVEGRMKTNKEPSPAIDAGVSRRGIGGVSRAAVNGAPGKKRVTRLPSEERPEALFGPVGSAAKMTIDSGSAIRTKAPLPDLPTISKIATATATVTKPWKRAENLILDSDPITFTSSPDFAQLNRGRIKHRDAARSKPKDLPDFDEPAPKPSAAPKTSNALEALDSDSDSLPELPGISTTTRTLSRTTSDTSYLHKSTSAPAKKPLSRSKSLADQATVKSKKRVPKTADEKAAEAAEKLAAKEAATAEKKKLREEKARDKIIAQDLAKVNTLKTDKKKSTPEMIVLFPVEMDNRLRETAEGFLGKLEVGYTGWAGAGTTIGEQLGSGEVKNVIRWKRKVDAVYNSNEDIWEPVPRRIELEKHILCHLPAKKFVELATAHEGEGLDNHVERLKTRWSGYKIIYLIEGLAIWQKKNTSLRNRQFASAVRAQGAEDSAPASSQSSTTKTGRPKKKKAAQEYISDDLIEDALLSLQVKHGSSGSVVIHHTASLVESAEWISIFTQHISTIPYRLQKMNLDTSFCMESGQVRAGEDKRDTFVKMLCEMRGVTAPVGWGIESELGDGVSSLIERFRKAGKEALKEVKKSANRDGAFTDRPIGKAISKRVYNVFMGTDPGSTDV